MKTIKYRLDFTAHYSIVVEVPDEENSEENAIKIGEDCITKNDIVPCWDLDDGGIEVAEEDEEPVNDVYIDFIDEV